MDFGNDFEEDCYSWLFKENVEDRIEEDLSGFLEMVFSGYSVGGVVYSIIFGIKVNYRFIVGIVLYFIVNVIRIKK